MEEEYKPLTKTEAKQLEMQFINEPLYRTLREWLSSKYTYHKYQFPAEIWNTAKEICYRMGGSSYPDTILAIEYDNLRTDYDYYNEKYKFGHVQPHDEYAANLVLECCYFMIACSCSTTKEMRSNLMNFIDDKLDDWKENFRKDFVKRYKAFGKEELKIDYLEKHENKSVLDDSPSMPLSIIDNLAKANVYTIGQAELENMQQAKEITKLKEENAQLRKRVEELEKGAENIVADIKHKGRDKKYVSHVISSKEAADIVNECYFPDMNKGKAIEMLSSLTGIPKTSFQNHVKLKIKPD